MRYPFLIITVALTISGCNDTRKIYSEDEIQDMAQDEAARQVAPLEARVAQLEDDQKKLTDQLNTVRSLSIDTYDAHQSLIKTFNHNVALDNRQRAADLTAAGACGKEWRQASSGVAYLANKECTVKDLR